MEKLIIAVVGGSLLISVGLIFGLPAIKSSGGQMEINPLEYNLGDISMAAGPVTKTYEIKNNGDTELKIDKIWTSCDCTTALLRIVDRVSPELGMHTKLPLWSEKLAPGETGFLDLTFDPAFHGHEGVGQITRAAYISTSDLQNSKAEVRLIANVTH